jgi:hypothetical protein
MMDKSTLDAITAFGSIGVMIATFILAMFTAWLAFTTREMARSTTRLTQQENQQHVDNLRPICVLEPNGVRLNNQNFLVKDPHSTPSNSVVILNGTICNKGMGPATHIKVALRILDKHQDFVQAVYSGVIQVGEEWPKYTVGNMKNVVPVQIKFYDKYNDSDFPTIDTGAWEIYLEYKDIFGNDYHTKYTKAGENFFAGNFKGPRPELDKTVLSSAGSFGPEDTDPLTY